MELPEFVYSEMDQAIYYRSLTLPEPGDTVTREDGKQFTVRYSWPWTTIRGVPIYMAELDPVTAGKPEGSRLRSMRRRKSS